MIEKHINKVNVNPFFASLIFQSFYNGYESDKCSILLHYLVLPLTMYSETRNIFSRVNVRNNLENIVKTNKLEFSDIQDKVWALKKLTNLTLINLHTQKCISLHANVEVYEKTNYEDYSEIKDYLRSATYVGKLFKNETDADIFKHLKVII